jgi:hypothetical protein
MKAINLKHYTHPNKASSYIKDHSYTMVLYWDQQVSFKGKYELENFITRLNELLTSNLFELVELYNILHGEFWKTWFYLDDRNRDHKKLRYECEYCFSAVEKQLNLSVERCGWENGNFIAIGSINKILGNLRTANNLLIGFRNNKKQYIESRILKVTGNRIDHVEEKMKSLVDYAMKNSQTEGNS